MWWLNRTRSTARSIVACFGLALLLGAFTLGAEPPVGVSPVAGEESPAAVAYEAQACSNDANLFGLPVAFMATSVVPGCPADGNICLDGDLCRAQCRICGIELGVCVWGICRCFDN